MPYYSLVVHLAGCRDMGVSPSDTMHLLSVNGDEKK